MPTIFINYRREESAGEARALFNDLVAQLGSDAVFMDVDSIAPGQDFRTVVQQRLASCDLMLSLVGKEWLTVTTRDGRRRLDDPGDFVRLEIEGALKRGIPVAPVLLHGTTMPSPDSLPESLRDFAFRNAFELSHTRWESDVDEMLRRLKLVPALSASTSSPVVHHTAATVAPPPTRARGVVPALAVLAVLLVAGAAAYWWSRGEVNEDTTPASASAIESAAVESDEAPAPADPVDSAAPPAVDSSVDSASPDRSSATSPRAAADAAADSPSDDESTAGARANAPPVGQRIELGTQGGGDEMCAERLAIRLCANRPAQRWSLEQAGGDNRVRIHNAAAGPNMCLDVVNDGSNSRLTMARCGDFSGQSWSVTPAGQAARFFQFRNDFTGRGRCLAAVEDGAGTSLQLAPCAGTPAQRWRLTPRP